ncbi:MAG: hypothetical protein ACFFDF_25610 [Candidatus Odinarchaeota archaeon]
MSIVKKEFEIKYYDLRHIPEKYKNMDKEEKKKHLQALKEQMNAGVLNIYEIAELIGLYWILIKEEGIS